jgi:hypothetical protein
MLDGVSNCVAAGLFIGVMLRSFGLFFYIDHGIQVGGQITIMPVHPPIIIIMLLIIYDIFLLVVFQANI